jgi:hypothetical protein
LSTARFKILAASKIAIFLCGKAGNSAISINLTM